MKLSIDQRFKKKFERRGKNTCWLWNGYCESSGYGIFYVGVGGRVKAHRMAYELFVGSIPEGKSVYHTCENNSCVNPEHLLVGSLENISNMFKTPCYVEMNYDPLITFEDIRNLDIDFIQVRKTSLRKAWV